MESPHGNGRCLFGRRASEDDEVPAPKAYADARRPCVQPRTQYGNQYDIFQGHMGTGI